MFFHFSLLFFTWENIFFYFLQIFTCIFSIEKCFHIYFILSFAKRNLKNKLSPLIWLIPISLPFYMVNSLFFFLCSEHEIYDVFEDVDKNLHCH